MATMRMMTINTGKSCGLSFFILLLLLEGFTVNGQIKDFQTRFGASVTGEIITGLDLSLDIEQRFNNNSLRYDRSLITAGVEYDLGRGFDISAGARWILMQNREMEFKNRYRLNGDFSYRYNFYSFSFRARTRFQYGFDDQVLRESFTGSKLVDRNRVEIVYHIFGTRITLAAGGEIYLHLNNLEGVLLYRSKIYGGVDYDFNLRNSMGISYTFDNEFSLAEPFDAYILGISYRFRL